MDVLGRCVPVLAARDAEMRVKRRAVCPPDNAVGPRLEGFGGPVVDVVRGEQWVGGGTRAGTRSGTGHRERLYTIREVADRCAVPYMTVSGAVWRLERELECEN